MQDCTPDFRQLLDRARAGDVAALDELVREYESELMRVVKAQLGNALRPYVDSVDLVQSVHKSVLVGLRDNKLDIQTPEHLIRLAATIVRRKIARYWRRHRRQTRLENVGANACDDQSLASLILTVSKTSVDHTMELDLNERLMRVMQKLEPVDRRVIELRLEGCSTAEAARRLELNSDVLRARLGRIRRKLELSGITADWF